MDRRLERRELTDDELRLLLDTARTGKPSLGLTGWQRFTLYATALGAGLRANELASLTRRSFDLAGETATVTIEAASEKARRGDTLPLPPDLAEMLRPWLATIEENELLWPGKWAQQKRASKFLQVDLANARQAWLDTAADDAQRQAMDKTDFLKYRDRDGQQADFHALRHTYLSRLGRSGASAKVMQRLARHSTVELTIGRYTHAGLSDLSAAVNKLPSLTMDTPSSQNGQPELAPVKTTGNSPVSVARIVARAAEKTGLALITADETEADNVESARNAKRPENQGVCEPLMTADKRRGRDSNPGWTCIHAGFQDRCNRPLCHLSGGLGSIRAASYSPARRLASCAWDNCGANAFFHFGKGNFQSRDREGAGFNSKTSAPSPACRKMRYANGTHFDVREDCRKWKKQKDLKRRERRAADGRNQPNRFEKEV